MAGEAAASESPEVTPLALGAVAAFALACLGFHLAAGWVPLLDSANLAIHEAGHPLVGLVSSRLSVYGGTLFQLAFPAALAWDFHRRGHATGAAACGVWLGENLLNVARYMADARAGELPLVGGGEHDWLEIFTRWGLLAHDSKVAALARLAALALIAASLLWLYRRWREARDAA
jgi:hypothetical protein